MDDEPLGLVIIIIKEREREREFGRNNSSLCERRSAGRRTGLTRAGGQRKRLIDLRQLATGRRNGILHQNGAGCGAPAEIDPLSLRGPPPPDWAGGSLHVISEPVAASRGRNSSSSRRRGRALEIGRARGARAKASSTLQSKTSRARLVKIQVDDGHHIWPALVVDWPTTASEPVG
jgi:hypothetical protein